MVYVPDYSQNPPLLPVQAPSFLPQCLRLSRSGRRLFVDSTCPSCQESCHQNCYKGTRHNKIMHLIGFLPT